MADVDGGVSSGADGGFGLTLTGIAFVYVAWRILVFVGYHTITALGIVQVGGAGNVAMGLPYLPLPSSFCSRTSSGSQESTSSGDRSPTSLTTSRSCRATGECGSGVAVTRIRADS